MAAEKRPQEIPGYYFDKEKKKYFAIQPGTEYSFENVKRRRLNDSKVDAAQTLEILRKPYIKRSRILQDPLDGGLLGRETGGKFLHECTIAAGLDGPEMMYEDKPHRESNSAIPAFDWDPVTRGLFIPKNDYCMLAACPESPPDVAYGGAYDPESTTRRRRPLYNWQNCRNLVYEPKKITTINVNATARLVCVTRDDIFGDFGIVITLLKDQVAVADDPERIIADGSHVHVAPRNAPHKAEMNVWTSIAAPSTSSLSFVVGLDNTIMTIGKESATVTTNTRWVKDKSLGETAFRALEFLHEHPDTLLAGDRGGEISLVDLRVEQNPKFGQDTIHYPSFIRKIKSIDDHRILVAGPSKEWRGEICGSTMLQYDLRWRKNSIVRGQPNTKPVLEYADHHNTFPHFGIDVDVDAGLVAAAQEDQTVQLFSLHGGHKLDFASGNRKWKQPIESLRFAADRYGSTRSLYVGGVDSIHRYAW